MAANKTAPTDVDPREFVAAIEDEAKRADAERLLELFAELTKQPPVMWGEAIVGYGSYDYRDESDERHGSTSARYLRIPHR